jgi:hypothetical protein
MKLWKLGIAAAAAFATVFALGWWGTARAIRTSPPVAEILDSGVLLGTATYDVSDMDASLWRTDGVRAKPGMSFGYKIHIESPRNGAIKVQLALVPGAGVDPDSRLKPPEPKNLELFPQKLYTLVWRMEDPPLSTGQWRLVLRAGKQDLAGRNFFVYKP